MAVRQVSAESSVTPNLVPMVDIMFLLLLFLMVGADMGQRELEDVRLPLASRSEEAPKDRPQELTVNVFHRAASCPGYEAAELCADRSHWAVSVRGSLCEDEAALGARIAGEAAAFRERTGEDLLVSVRADRSALYERVQQVVGACAAAKVFKVEVAASRGE